MKKESIAKGKFSLIGVCDFVTKYCIYALIFLVPIFFLPWTVDALDFNKQALMFLLVFISVFALMLKTLISGKFKAGKSVMHIVAGILFLVYLLVTIFSQYRYGSFWGAPQQSSQSMLTVVCFLLFYFLISNIFSKEEISTSVVVLSFSVIISELIGVLQLFGLFIIPFGFAKSAGFNLIGSTGSLGLLAAMFLPLAIVFLIIIKKWWRVLFILGIIFSALILILINYPIIWWVVIAGSAAILILGTIKRNLFDGRWMALPMFFLVIALFFVILNPQINWLPQKPNEIVLLQQTGLNIAGQSIKAMPIFGSGLGTFAYDFSKFKSLDFAKSSLWNVTFNQSSSKVLNDLATTGLFGFLAILAFMIFPVFYGIKFFLNKKETGDALGSEKSADLNHSILLLGVLVVLVEFIVASFLYNSNFVLDFVFFFAVSCVIGLISENRKTYALKNSSFLSLLITFAFTIVFIFGLGLLILDGQKYMAEVNYYNGLIAYQNNQKDAGLKNLEAAARLNSESDVYFRQLSQAYLLSLQDELKNVTSTPSEEEKTKVQTLASNAINASKLATNLNPNDANNWSSLGYVYQSLLSLSGNDPALAISAYNSALKLDPNNIYLYAQEGNVYLAEYLNSPSASTKADLAKAQTLLEKAVALNPSYSDGLYSLGLVYSALGQIDKSITEFELVQQLNPTDQTIQKILDNLNAGKPILQTATPPSATPPTSATDQTTTPSK